MDEKFNKKRFDNKYLKDINPNYRDDIALKIIFKNQQKYKSIIDIGCNNYILISKINKVNSKFELFVNDITDINLKNKPKIISNKYIGDFVQLKIKRKFDLIVSLETIEHVFKTDQFIKKINKSLNANGELIISTPNTFSLGRRISYFLGINKYLEFHEHYPNSGHIRYFSFDNLIWLLKQNNFEIINSYSSIISYGENKFFKLNSFTNAFLKKFGADILIHAKKI